MQILPELALVQRTIYQTLAVKFLCQFHDKQSNA